MVASTAFDVEPLHQSQDPLGGAGCWSFWIGEIGKQGLIRPPALHKMRQKPEINKGLVDGIRRWAASFLSCRSSRVRSKNHIEEPSSRRTSGTSPTFSWKISLIRAPVFKTISGPK